MIRLLPLGRLEPRTTERRRSPRRAVTWTVTLSVEDRGTLAGTATDASLHGLRVAFADAVRPLALCEGMRCHVEVRLAGGEARFVRHGEIRHVRERGIGLLLSKALPIDVHLREGEAAGHVHVTVSGRRGDEPMSLSALLRSQRGAFRAAPDTGR